MNDRATSPSGRPLSMIFHHTGIKANAMAIFQNSDAVVFAVTGDYSGFALRQDNGLLDEGTTAVDASWTSSKLDFEAPETVKMITDLNAVTRQISATNLSVSVSTQTRTATASPIIAASGGSWAELWGTLLWSGPSTVYTRLPLTLTVPTGS